MYRKLERFHNEELHDVFCTRYYYSDKIDVCGRIILKWTLKKWTANAWMSSPVS